MRFGRLPMSVVKGEQYVALQQLTRARYQIVRQITQEKQRFLQYLSYKCNTFTEDVESSVFGKAMMDLFLENYSLEELSRSEEHTSELQSRGHLVCRLLLEKKKKQIHHNVMSSSSSV